MISQYIIGLLGKTLKHSFSKDYFTNKFILYNLKNFEYKNFELPHIDNFTKLISENFNLIGLNVTIPYKEQILKYVDKKSYEVEKIGATNTILIEKINNKTIISAYNTDIYGFEVSLNKFIEKKINSALIIGNGGASKAVGYVLEKMGIKFNIVARNRKLENDILFEELTNQTVKNTDLIVNTTPVGQFPNVYEKLNFPFDAISNNHYCYDLIYNPSKTLFLQYAEKNGAKIINGLQMLYLQADKSWGLFYEAAKRILST